MKGRKGKKERKKERKSGRSRWSHAGKWISPRQRLGPIATLASKMANFSLLTILFSCLYSLFCWFFLFCLVLSFRVGRFVSGRLFSAEQMAFIANIDTGLAIWPLRHFDNRWHLTMGLVLQPPSSLLPASSLLAASHTLGRPCRLSRSPTITAQLIFMANWRNLSGGIIGRRLVRCWLPANGRRHGGRFSVGSPHLSGKSLRLGHSSQIIQIYWKPCQRPSTLGMDAIWKFYLIIWCAVYWLEIALAR